MDMMCCLDKQVVFSQGKMLFSIIVLVAIDAINSKAFIDIRWGHWRFVSAMLNVNLRPTL